MNQEQKHWGNKPFVVIVPALLLLLSAANFKIIKDPFVKLIQQNLSFQNFVDEIKEGYISDSFAFKYDFINLNGLFARLTGRRTLNKVVKLNNGMLGGVTDDADVTALASEIGGLSYYLSEQNIPLLYVQLPHKDSLDGQSFPVGVKSYGNKKADNLLYELSSGEVRTLDLRPLLSQTPEMLEQYFYRTDHHWNSDGAFVAFQEISGCLYELFPEGNVNLAYAETDQWERHSINDWFLGSNGKRVGVYFGGTDPLIWYTPKFETEMSCAIPAYGSLFQGDFTEANIRSRYIEEKNYFDYSAYCVYIGGDYPLVQHRNLDAPSPLKVVMLKDSFTLPLQAFLSTVFREIDVIDPRFFSDCKFAEYVERVEPDIVIIALSPSAIGMTAYENLGVEETASIRADGGVYETIAQQDVVVEKSDNKYYYTAYPLDSGTYYRVSFDGVDVLEGQTEGVGLRIYDYTAGIVLESAIFDLAYCDAADGFNWVFRTPDTQDELQLLFYAGIYGSADGNSIVYRNMTLEKWISE